MPIRENNVFIGLKTKIIFRPLLRPDSFLHVFMDFGPNIRVRRLLGAKYYFVPFLPNFPNHESREEFPKFVEN